MLFITHTIRADGQKDGAQLGYPKDKYTLLLLKFVNAQLSFYGYLCVGLWTTTNSQHKRMKKTESVCEVKRGRN